MVLGEQPRLLRTLSDPRSGICSATVQAQIIWDGYLRCRDQARFLQHGLSTGFEGNSTDRKLAVEDLCITGNDSFTCGFAVYVTWVNTCQSFKKRRKFGLQPKQLQRSYCIWHLNFAQRNEIPHVMIRKEECNDFFMVELRLHWFNQPLSCCDLCTCKSRLTSECNSVAGSRRDSHSMLFSFQETHALLELKPYRILNIEILEIRRESASASSSPSFNAGIEIRDTNQHSCNSVSARLWDSIWKYSASTVII